jgi:hypothetical protein
MMLCRKIEFFHALISKVLCFNVFRIGLRKDGALEEQNS